MKPNKIIPVKQQDTPTTSSPQQNQKEQEETNFLTLKRLEEKYTYNKLESENVVKSGFKHVKKYYKPSGTCLLQFVLNRFPFVSWVKNYDAKENLLKDISAGITIGIIQIPQGM